VAVTGSRAVSEKIVGYSPVGADIREVSLSYRVNVADLDLTDSAGKSELKKRVKAAAGAACKELDRLALVNLTSAIQQNPGSTPGSCYWPFPSHLRANARQATGARSSAGCPPRSAQAGQEPAGRSDPQRRTL
jgi:UrcA family protein